MSTFDPIMSAHESTGVVIKALLANLGIAAAKFAGAFVSGSAALLAEAIHSLVDCLNQVLLLVGSKAASRAPTARHPLGFGKESFFWSFLVAILLFSLGGVFAVSEGIHKIGDAETMSSPGLGLVVLGVGALLEGFSFHACLVEIRKQNPWGSLWAWFRKTTSADLLVVFTEDLAALIGLLIAATCIATAWATGNPNWDAYGSILVGVLLITVAIFLAIEIKSLIIGEAPSAELRPGIQSILEAQIPGARILNFIAIQTGAREVMVSYKITPGALREVSELIEAINRMEREVKIRFPQVKWQFVEPDHVS